jgi:hypothetical protein
MSQLLAQEQKAKLLVDNLGVDRSHRLLTAICNRIERRIRRANRMLFTMFIDNSCVRKYHWEIELIGSLKLGIQMLNQDTPERAHDRILARRKKRQEVRNKLNGCY